MNSLNIISGRVSPPASPTSSRSNSFATLGLAVAKEDDDRTGSGGGHTDPSSLLLGEQDTWAAEPDEFCPDSKQPLARDADVTTDEETPLLPHSETKEISPRASSWSYIPKRIATTVWNSIRWVFSTLAAPGVYLIACFYDEAGNFAPLKQLRKLFGHYHGDTRKMVYGYHEAAAENEKTRRIGSARLPAASAHQHAHGLAAPSRSSGSSSSSGLSSESDSDASIRGKPHARSKSLQDAEEIAPARRSIRIKLHSNELLRQRKHRKAQSASGAGARSSAASASASTAASAAAGPGDISAQLKSPTSPNGALTRYPRTPAPPRPLIPRRQPSYVNMVEASAAHQKTLILDLDETLIHSMSKGGRMGSGHMVEVKLNTTYVAVGGQASIGPQHPILYFVHKRPHCDDFLRRVSICTSSWLCPAVADWLRCARRSASGTTSSSLRPRYRNTPTP